MLKTTPDDAIDVHAYLDESRISASKLDYLAKKNNLRTIIVSPPCTKNHEPDKSPVMYWFQRLLLKTSFFNIFAEWISNSFYNSNGELRPIWRLFTRKSLDLIKIIHPDNNHILKEIAPYKDRLKMWYWINPLDDINIEELEKQFLNSQIFGLKIHAYWHDVDLSNIDKYAEFCRKINCPLYVILGYGKASNILALINSCKDVNVILGYGGFPIYTKAWNQIKNVSNFYIDLTSFHLDRSLIKKALKTLGSEKCIFGTDCPYNFYDASGGFSYDKTFERTTFNFLSPQDYKNIFRDNVLKISRH